MTGYLIILLCVLGIIIEYQMQKKFGVLSLFCVLWTFIIVLAEMRLFGMVEVSEKIYFELLLGTGSFIIFFLCGRFGKDNNLNRKIRLRKVNDSAFVFNLPAIYAKGFQGPVYATDATCNLCDIMLRDSAHIQMFEAEWRNRKGRRQGKPEFIPAYTMEDAMGVIRNFVSCPYEKTVKPAEGIEVR